MRNKIKFAFCFLLMCLLIIGINFSSFSQEIENELSVKLSKTENLQLVKANEFKNKGKLLEQGALTEQETTISKTELDKKKAEKKYAQKRMDASDLYAKSIELKQDLLKSSIKSFWKKYKGDKQAFVLAKSLELTSMDSLKKGLELRNKASKITKSAERLEKLLSAETILNKYCTILEKVAYVYLNWPTQFDQNWLATDDDKVPNKSQASQDSISKPTKDSILNLARHENLLITKSDTIKEQPVITGNNKIDTTESYTGAKAPDKTYGVSEIVKSSQLGHIVKDTSVLSRKDSIHFTKKDSTVFQGNDSSLYGKVKINEEEVDKFNNFLKRKYPDKYEDYVINFQNMDYSDIEGLKNSWHKYLYGSNDTAKYIGGIKKLKPDTLCGIIASIDTIHSSGINKMVYPDNKTNQTDSISNKVLIAKTKTKYNSKSSKDNKVASNNTKENTVSANLTKGKTTKSKNKEYIPTTGFQHISIDNSNDFVFHVQVVACRTQLSMKTVKSICNTNDSIIEFYEDNWYKYAIGTYTTYREASHKRNELKVSGVFVIAYLHGKRIKISPAIAYKRKGTATLKKQN